MESEWLESDDQARSAVRLFQPIDEDIERLAHAVIGAAIEVHKVLGPGFLESVYENALCAELTRRSIDFQRQVALAIDYKGEKVGEGRVDLLVGGRLIVELKAVEDFAKVHTAITISYLRATKLRLALLINFNIEVLKNGIKRIAS